MLSLAVERWTAGEQDVCDDANAPNINTLIVGHFIHDLGRHVKGRAEHLLQLELWVIEAGKAEVCQLDIDLGGVTRLLWGQQYILRLDVPVRDVLLVHVVESK